MTHSKVNNSINGKQDQIRRQLAIDNGFDYIFKMKNLYFTIRQQDSRLCNLQKRIFCLENIIRTIIFIDSILNYSPKITHIRQKYNISLLYKITIYFLPLIA